eukprot:gene6388-12924_t
MSSGTRLSDFRTEDLIPYVWPQDYLGDEEWYHLSDFVIINRKKAMANFTDIKEESDQYIFKVSGKLNPSPRYEDDTSQRPVSFTFEHYTIDFGHTYEIEDGRTKANDPNRGVWVIPLKTENESPIITRYIKLDYSSTSYSHIFNNINIRIFNIFRIHDILLSDPNYSRINVYSREDSDKLFCEDHIKDVYRESDGNFNMNVLDENPFFFYENLKKIFDPSCKLMHSLNEKVKSQVESRIEDSEVEEGSDEDMPKNKNMNNKKRLKKNKISEKKNIKQNYNYENDIEDEVEFEPEFESSAVSSSTSTHLPSVSTSIQNNIDKPSSNITSTNNNNTTINTTSSSASTTGTTANNHKDTTTSTSIASKLISTMPTKSQLAITSNITAAAKKNIEASLAKKPTVLNTKDLHVPTPIATSTATATTSSSSTSLKPLYLVEQEQRKLLREMKTLSKQDQLPLGITPVGVSSNANISPRNMASTTTTSTQPCGFDLLGGPQKKTLPPPISLNLSTASKPSSSSSTMNTRTITHVQGTPSSQQMATSSASTTSVDATGIDNSTVTSRDITHGISSYVSLSESSTAVTKNLPNLPPIAESVAVPTKRKVEWADEVPNGNIKQIFS